MYVFEKKPFVALSLKYQREVFMKIFIHITKLLSGFNRRNSTKKHKYRDVFKVQIKRFISNIFFHTFQRIHLEANQN